MSETKLDKLHNYINKNNFSLVYKNSTASVCATTLRERKNLLIEIAIYYGPAIVKVGVSLLEDSSSFKQLRFDLDDLFQTDDVLHEDIDLIVFELIL